MKTFLGVLALGALGVAANATQDAVKGWAWSDPELGKLTIEGVCSIDPANVSCWDKDGNALPDVAKAVKDKLTARNERVESRFGMKNRYLVTKWEGTPRSKPGFNFTVPKGLAYENSGLILVSVPIDSATTDVTMRFDNFEKPKLTLEPKNGKSAKQGDQEVKITKIVKAQGGAASLGTLQSAKAPTWRLFLEHKGIDLTKARATKALKDGDLFNFVDKDGNPILEENPPIKLEPSIAILQLGRPFFGEEWYIDTNINPDKLGEIGFSLPKANQVVFEKIPLDPK